MILNFKLVFKYIFNKNLSLFLAFNTKYNKNVAVTLPGTYLYYINLHLKLSTYFYSIQLIDLFAYEAPQLSTKSTGVTQILVLTYHIINSQKRLFLFIPNNLNILNKSKTFINKNLGFASIGELFFNASWLEREVSELHGLIYHTKKDMRNLMLVYGDSSAPFQKNFPTVGTHEIFYDAVNDMLIQQIATLQF